MMYKLIVTLLYDRYYLRTLSMAADPPSAYSLSILVKKLVLHDSILTQVVLVSCLQDIIENTLPNLASYRKVIWKGLRTTTPRKFVESLVL